MARPYNFVYINLYSLWKLLFFPYFPYSYQEWLFVDRLSTKDVKIICSFSKCMLMNCSTLLAIRLTWAQVHGYKREWFLWSFTPYHSKKKKKFSFNFFRSEICLYVLLCLQSKFCVCYSVKEHVLCIWDFCTSGWDSQGQVLICSLLSFWGKKKMVVYKVFYNIEII